jgi:hypothetical protein
MTPGDYFFGTQVVDSGSDEAWEASSGVATLTTSVAVTGTEDSTAGESVGVPLSLTLTMDADGTFSTSDSPAVITGVVISDTQAVAVDHQKSTPQILIFTMNPEL